MAVTALLSESQEPLIPLLQKTAHQLEQMTRFDQRLIEASSMI